MTQTPPSKHVIDLTKAVQTKHSKQGVIQDIRGQQKSDESDQMLRINRLKKKENPWTEKIRMMAIGVTIVFGLNVLNVYYQGRDLTESLITASYSHYESIVEEGNINEAQFQSATQTFEAAEARLWFLQDSKLQAGLEAGVNLSRAGGEFLRFLEQIQAILPQLFQSAERPRSSLTALLESAYEDHFKIAFSELLIAQEKLGTMNVALLPDDLKEQFQNATTEIDRLVELLSLMDEAVVPLLKLLGHEHPQQFLIMLQNNNEMRPGGGFNGSLVLAQLNDGYLDEMNFYDVYHWDGFFYEKIDPPGEITQLTDHWGLRDANTSPNIPTSALQDDWFLQWEGGPSSDQVVLIDLSAVEALLEITGPIEIDSIESDSKIELTAQNISTVLSYIVESKQWGATTPKKIIGEMMPVVMDRLMTNQPWPELLNFMHVMADAKHISLYSKDETLQTFFMEWGLAGSTPPVNPDEDYFMAVHTSLGGNKSDAFLEQNIHHHSFLQTNGEVWNQVTITRHHAWDEGVEEDIRGTLETFGFTTLEATMLNILGRGPNKSGLRLYVPQGSTLVNATGIDLETIELHEDPDVGTNYFYLQDTLFPGETHTLTLTYTLPFTLDFRTLDEYRLSVGKQPGDIFTTFTKTVTGDNRLNRYRVFPEGGIQNQKLERDLNIAELWGL